MSTYPSEPEKAYHAPPEYVSEGSSPTYDNEKGMGMVVEQEPVLEGEGHQYKRTLKGRHMQMIAIGGAIGAGFFVGSGSALQSGGPASLIICFSIIGVMLLLTMQALGELGVLFPVNGAFFTYAIRFIDRSWGFAAGWDYAIQWLTILPFEITAAGLTIAFWSEGAAINIGVWITVFLIALSAIQIFGVRGYGEVEFVLSIIKIVACTGFIILGIVINCGGVHLKDAPTSYLTADDSTRPLPTEGYIGGYYWNTVGAFRNGFQGFCAVFVTASFAFGGTELTGLAAAEAANPIKSIPRATRQVFWRITFFYVIGLMILGLIVPADSATLLNASGAHTKYSPFVLAMTNVGIKGLPSVFNVVICLSVLSVANSSAYASTRTLQALAANGMGPKFLAYIDKHGRPLYCVFIQLAFGLLAFVNEATKGGPQFFNWLLALSGLANFFIWGTICLSHIRFRAGWKAQGHTLDELPYKATFGVMGSWVGFGLNVLCLIASFYAALFPLGGSPDPETFFQQYLAAPLILSLYLGWKLYTRDWKLFISASEMDVTSGLRVNISELKELAQESKIEQGGVKNWPMRVIRGLF